jgi:hypothetical protein
VVVGLHGLLFSPLLLDGHDRRSLTTSHGVLDGTTDGWAELCGRRRVPVVL